VRPFSLQPGVHAEFACQPTDPLDAAQQIDLTHAAVGIAVYAYGRIAYTDESGAHRHTGFCRYWTMPKGTTRARFVRLGDDEYEYED
jgi:hypothetical protein